MLRIGLTGGIGAGKSTVAKVFEAHGATIIDADKIARQILEPGSDGLAAVVAEFGGDVLGSDGSLDRAALAAKAFATPEATAALNAITHPRVGEETGRQLAVAAAKEAETGVPQLVIQDIPLLVEKHYGAMFALVIVVWADVEERVGRLVNQRGMDEADARARIAAQATDLERRAAADIWLGNSGAPADLAARVERLLTERIEPFAANLHEGRAVPSEPEVDDYDASWPEQARRLIERIWFAGAAFPGLITRIDHVGSTAIPEFPAKDVLDIQVSVAADVVGRTDGGGDADEPAQLAGLDGFVAALAGAGLVPIDGITADSPKPFDLLGNPISPEVWSKRVLGSADPGRRAHVHLRVAGSPGQQFALAFRDWIIANEGVRAEYLGVKRVAELVAGDADDAPGAAREAYVGVKEPWFDEAYGRVAEWVRETGWSA